MWEEKRCLKFGRQVVMNKVNYKLLTPRLLLTMKHKNYNNWTRTATTEYYGADSVSEVVGGLSAINLTSVR